MKTQKMTMYRWAVYTPGRGGKKRRKDGGGDLGGIGLVAKEGKLHNMEQGSTSKTRPKQQFTPTQSTQTPRKTPETHASRCSGFG